LPEELFNVNQVAALFGVAFLRHTRTVEPNLNARHALHQGVDLSKVSFKQPVGALRVGPAVEVLGTIADKPAIVALPHGKGRVIIVAAPRLFVEYGLLRDRKEGKTKDIIDEQARLLDGYLRWLAANSLNLGKLLARDFGQGKNVFPRGHIETDGCDIYFIPQLQPTAEKLAAQWEVVWADFSHYLGVSSPVEFVERRNPDEKLVVLLRAARGGGLSGGTRVSIPALGEESTLIGVLGHEVGHKLLRGVNVSTSEGFACWLGIRARRAVGLEKEADARLQAMLTEFRKVDPTGNKLDITDPLADIRQGGACQGKWVWILTELERKYGPDFLKRYVAVMRTKRIRHLEMADVVASMSEAAGEDLTDWFRGLGIKATLSPVEKAASTMASPRPSMAVADGESGAARGATGNLPGVTGQSGKSPPPLPLAPFTANEARQHQQTWAGYLGVEMEMTNSIGMKLVLVPPGEFVMGHARTVRLTKAFYLSKYEVTVAEFRQFVEATGYRTDAEKGGQGGLVQNIQTGRFDRRVQSSWRAAGHLQEEDHPVLMVSWNDAEAFCSWLAQKEAKVYRLPTEAQWEFGCRAGTTTRWPTGAQPRSLREVANLADQALARQPGEVMDTMPWDDGFAFTSPVGTFRANDFGLHDLLGNAWEWCRDWYATDDVSRNVKEDPVGPASGTGKVTRGGGWNGHADFCAADNEYRRKSHEVTFCTNTLGFRVVCEIEQTPDLR